MKKVNKKGFILVETLVVTVFVVTLFIFVYRITVPSIGEYEMQNYYDDIDSVYNTNLFKQMITRYADIDYIDSYLLNHTYMDISNCSDTTLYTNNDYCQLIKTKLSIRGDDKILLTHYNISDFRTEVKNNDFFDSGTLSNFRDYLNTVSNNEPFYSKITSTTNYIGKYRLFIIRTVEDADGSTSRRYSNMGVYTGKSSRFLVGDTVYFNPGDGEKKFYVLKTSPSTDPYVTLIYDRSLPNSNNVCFNTSKTVGIPNTILDSLKSKTNSWNNANYLTGYSYKAPSGYIINYNGYRARLLEENDILEALGCKEDDKTCFDPNEAFEVEFEQDKVPFLIDNMAVNESYWTGIAVPNSDYWERSDLPIPTDVSTPYKWALAWVVKKHVALDENGNTIYNADGSQKITTSIMPVGMNDCSAYIRPILRVEKTKVRKEG